MVIKVKRASTPRGSGDEPGCDADAAQRTKLSRKSLESLQDSGDAPVPSSNACFQLVDPACPETSAVLLPKVAAALEKLLDSLEGSAEISSQAKASPFHGLRPPPITLVDYLHRIAHYTKCSPACFVSALAYMDWIYQRDPSMAPCPLSIHRLMLVGSLLATKLLDDKRHSNSFWARVGGVPLHEINSLELQMMTLLDHRLLVTPEVLRRYIRQLQAGTLVLGYENASDALGRKRRSTGGYSSCAMSAGSEPRKSSRRDGSHGGPTVSGPDGPDCSMGSVGKASSGHPSLGQPSSGVVEPGEPYSHQASFCSGGLVRQNSIGHDTMSMGSVGVSTGRGGVAGHADGVGDEEDDDMATDSEGPSKEVVEQVAPRQGSASSYPQLLLHHLHHHPGTPGSTGGVSEGEGSGHGKALASTAMGALRRPALSAGSGMHASPAHPAAVEEDAGTTGGVGVEVLPPLAVRSVSASGTRPRGPHAPRRVSWADAKRSAGARDMEH